jgi:hypothetical protein
MSTSTKDSRHGLLRGAFFICETVFVASFAGMMNEYFHDPSSNPSMAFVITFWISLLALLAVCFKLWHTARQLAVIGLTTALVLVLLGLITPKL